MKGGQAVTATNSEKEDCLGCRAVGTLTCAAVAGYTLHLRATTLKSNTGQRLFLACFGAAAAGLAIHNAIVD